MAMFSFDEQAALFDVTPLPNQFILNYLPEASGDAVRVYSSAWWRAIITRPSAICSKWRGS